MRQTQVKRTPGPAAGDRKIARAHNAPEVDKAIFDVVRFYAALRMFRVADRPRQTRWDAGLRAAWYRSPWQMVCGPCYW